MFGIGIPEMLVIVVVAALVFGPEKLPMFARETGRMLRQLRAIADKAREDISSELNIELPEIALADLDPRQVVRKHIADVLNEEDVPRHDPA